MFGVESVDPCMTPGNRSLWILTWSECRWRTLFICVSTDFSSELATRLARYICYRPSVRPSHGWLIEEEAKLSLGQPTLLPHSTFGVAWRYRSRDHLIPHMPFPIGDPLEPSLSVSRYSTSNVAQSWHDLDTTSKQRSRSFILVPIDFSYTTDFLWALNSNFCS